MAGGAGVGGAVSGGFVVAGAGLGGRSGLERGIWWWS